MSWPPQTKDHLTKEVADIMRASMEGRIDFPTSLARRLALFRPNSGDIDQLVAFLQTRITPSVARDQKSSQVQVLC